MSGPRIVVVGSTMIDMITYAQKVPSSGETVQGDSFALGFGGKGANQAVMAAHFGAHVFMVNTVGDDVFGDSTLKNFHEQGIDTTYVNQTSGASGVAPIWVEPDGTNRIICVAGTNDLMTTEDAVKAISTIPDISVVIGQLEIPQEVTVAAFKTAQNKGIPTILNPAPFALLSADLIAASDWIIPNETEFAGLHPQGKAPNSDSDILELARILRKKIVVTLGQQGAAFVDSNENVIRVAAPIVSAKDTTGAGDAFVGAFAFGLASGLSEVQSITLGCACASDSVTRTGTQSSYPTKEQAQLLLSHIN